MTTVYSAIVELWTGRICEIKPSLLTDRRVPYSINSASFFKNFALVFTLLGNLSILISMVEEWMSVSPDRGPMNECALRNILGVSSLHGPQLSLHATATCLNG